MDSVATHMIVISILEARNVYKFDASKSSKEVIFVEARFNNESLVSDQVPLGNTNPKLMTKLCWELSRKWFQIFRKERKPIKLQCFMENDLHEKRLIGYTILDLRSVQELIEPKFEWRPLLNTKYKGPSHLRPELLLALQFIPSTEEQAVGIYNNRDTQLMNQSDNCFALDDLENDINVLVKDGVYCIWDASKNYPQECSRRLTLSIFLSNSTNLYQLVKLPTKLEECPSFHIEINLFRDTIKSDTFFDLRKCDMKAQNIDFDLDIDHISTLRSYFDLQPTLELKLCDQKSNIYGFVTISLTQLFSDQSNEHHFNKIEGAFQLLPNHDVIQSKEPYPSINLTIELTSSGKTSANKTSLRQLVTSPKQAHSVNKLSNSANSVNSLVSSPISHFCLILDIRSITIKSEIILPLYSCFVQYSYPFFGRKEKLKSSKIRASKLSEYVFEKGCFEFNFTTSLHKLDETFCTTPLVLDIIEESSKNTLLGMATVHLNDIFNVIPIKEDIEIKIKSVPVINANYEVVAEIMLIFALQNFGSNFVEQDLIQVQPIANSNRSWNGVDDLLMDAAYEIEVWKENQLKTFKSDLKQKELECVHLIEDRLKQKELEHESNLKSKLRHVYDLEERLTLSLKSIDLKQRMLEEKRLSLEKKEKEITSRFQRLDQEITKAIGEIKLSYESEANEKLQCLEEDKKKLKEKILMLEAKLNEKVEEIEKYEKRFNSLTNVSGNSHDKLKLPGPKMEIRSRAGAGPASRPIDLVSSNLNKINAINLANKANQSAIKRNKFEKVSLAKDNKNEYKNKAAALLAEIEKERNNLIKNGLSKHHPIIREIDAHLQ